MNSAGKSRARAGGCEGVFVLLIKVRLEDRVEGNGVGIAHQGPHAFGKKLRLGEMTRHVLGVADLKVERGDPGKGKGVDYGVAHLGARGENDLTVGWMGDAQIRQLL